MTGSISGLRSLDGDGSGEEGESDGSSRDDDGAEDVGGDGRQVPGHEGGLRPAGGEHGVDDRQQGERQREGAPPAAEPVVGDAHEQADRKSTRLNSSHVAISY